MAFAKPEIESIRQNGITKVALPRLDDPEIIPLWFGEGDVSTSELIRAAARNALDEGDTFYVHTRGRQNLRDAIKRYLDRLYGIDVHPDRVTVPGSSMLAITLGAQMALGRGEHGLIVSPHWPNIENTMRVTGADVGIVRQRFDGGRWHLPIEDIAAAIRPNTRMIFVNSPCNPTGWVMSPNEQHALLELCRPQDILILADEVYHRTVYEGNAAPSFLQVAKEDDPVVVVNGFSKAWAMTGWRVGWMIAPARYTETLSAMSECFNTGTTVFTQPAAIVALEQGEPIAQRLRDDYAGGRAIVMRMLGQDPLIEISEPEGAFYVFPRIPGLRSSLEFAERLADEAKVGVAPGYTFGPDNDEYFRICFAQSHQRLEEALHRTCEFVHREHASLVHKR